jgi:hypothetical protein
MNERLVRPTYLWTVVAVIALGAVAGRWDSPVPAGFADSALAQPDTAKSLPFVVDLTVSGPSVLECDERARFTATIRLSDGSTRDVTSWAEWTTSSVAVLTARNDGRTQAAAAGQSMLTARYGGRAASRTVTVVPSYR